MSCRKDVILNPSDLVTAKPVVLSTNGQKQKDADGYGLSRLASRPSRADLPSIVVEVNMLPNPTLDDAPVPGEKSEPAQPLPFRKRYLGIFLGLISSAVFAITTLLVKVLSARYHPVNLGFWRFQGILLPGIAFILYQHIFFEKSNVFGSVLPISSPGKKKTAFLLFLRGFLGATALLCQYYALTYISVADASVICFSTPITITILAYLILHEAFSIVQMLFAVVTLLGVFIIARPPFLTGAEEFDLNTLIGTGLSLCTMCLTTIVFLLLRFLRETHYLLIALVFGAWGSFQCLVIALAMHIFELPHGLMDWSLGISLALLTFLAQTMMTLALKYEQSGIISLIRCLDVVFAFIYQFIFLGVYPDLYSVAGAFLVVMSVAIIGFRKWVYELPENHSTRRLLRIILY